MGQKGSKRAPDLLDVQIEMRMASKQMQRESVRAIKTEKAERKKVADVILFISYRQ